jgi:hypothetical protein
MTSRAEEYALTSRELFAKAEEALAQSDLLQASEKLWGAAAHMVKGVAQRRGWGHTGHRELFQVVNRLAEETSDRELRTLFDIANSLHSNFYENWMPQEWIEDRAEGVREFLEKLEGLP